MYKKVLAPLDGSQLAECTIGEVANVAGPGAEVMLLQVLEPVAGRIRADVPAGLLSDVGVSDELLHGVDEKTAEAAKEYLKRAAASMKKKGFEVRSETKVGKPAETILGFAKDNKADVIVISTHGRSGASRWAFGSVADKVMRTATIPVLMVTPRGCHLE